MERNERASNQSARDRDDDALYAVYAPPGQASAAAPLPQLPGAWSARAMFVAAFRDQRRVPWHAWLLLGFLPALWCLPADALLRQFSAELTPDWRLQVKEAGYSLLHQLWVSVPVGGQTFIGLDIARERAASPRRFLEGARFAPAIFVVGAVYTLLIQLMLSPSFGAAEDDFRALTIGLAVMLALVVPVICAGFVYALVCYPLVERRRGLIDALKQVWDLLRASPWRYVRLALLSALLFAPMLAVYVATPVYVSSAFSALLYPTMQLAWAHAYLRSTAALEERIAAALGPSVAAKPRP